MCLLLSDWRSAPSRQAAASLVCRLSAGFIPRSTIGKETTCFCVAPLVAAPAEVTTPSSPRRRLSSGGLDCTSSSLNVSVCFFLKGLSVYDEKQKKTKDYIYFNLYLIFIIDEKLPETGRLLLFFLSLFLFVFIRSQRFGKRQSCTDVQDVHLNVKGWGVGWGVRAGLVWGGVNILSHSAFF